MSLISALLNLSESALPLSTLTRLSAVLTARPWGWFTQYLIRQFIREFHIDLDEVLDRDLSSYRTFNDFFTRKLREDARPIDASCGAIAPVDGTLAQWGTICRGQMLQAKGIYYSLPELLGGGDTDVRTFEEQGFACIYLSPRNYHRIHMPLAGNLTHTIHIPGRHFPVGRLNITHLPQLYTRNERLVCFFDTACGKFCVVMVAAALVGGIATPWAGTLVRSRGIETRTFPGPGLAVQRGEEIGMFKYGSTVLCLWQLTALHPAPETESGSEIRMGQPLLSHCQV